MFDITQKIHFLFSSKLKMKVENFDSKFLYFVIWFYRIIGVSFGGISLDERGTMIKSKFWYYYGWFGCCSHIMISLTITVIANTSGTFEKLWNSKFIIIKFLIIATRILLSIMMISISLIIQKYGFKIMNILIKYSLTKLKRLKTIAIIWSIHLVMIFTVFSVAFYSRRNLIGFFTSYYFDIILISFMYLISFISWIVSMNFTENIKIVRKQLNHNDGEFVTADLLIESNKFIKINFKKIKKIDYYLNIGLMNLVIGIIMSIFTLVYLLVSFTSYSLFFHALPFSISVSIVLILNCLINGKILEEALKLICVLDNIRINVNNDKLYKSLILSKRLIHEIKCGFTIGGFAPWNKLTLLQVNK